MPRVALPVIQEKPAGRVHCLQCAKCCTYVAIGMNAPTTPKLASEILWHLYHQGVSVCRDEAGEWYVQFEARCRTLPPGGAMAAGLADRLARWVAANPEPFPGQHWLR